MSYDLAVGAILQRINDVWGSTGPIAYPNKSFTIPDGKVTWARVTLEHVTGEQRTISQPDQLYTQTGIVIVQVFVPSGGGLGKANQSTPVKLIQSAFRGVQLAGGVFFMRVRPQEVGIDGPWFQTNVSALFQYDERT